MIRKGWFLAGLGLIAIFLSFVGATSVRADNMITVTTTDDVVNSNDGLCSLREAIIAANTNDFNVFGECERGSATDVDVIQLQAGETYTLSIDGDNEDQAQTGDLDILDNATPAVDVMIIAEGMEPAIVQTTVMDRIWHIHGAGFALENVETTGGNSDQGGGGLNNDNGQVALENAIFSLNTSGTGGAIFSRGANASLNLNNVEVTRNNGINPGIGAGIYNEEGMLIIIDSNLSGNTAMSDGGGLVNNNASAILTRTRVSGNLSGGCGGGIANKNMGVMTLITAEVTGINKADGAGAGLCNQATMSVTEGSIISTNEAKAGGGGIYSSGSLTIRNSFVQDNTALDLNNNSVGLGGGLFTVADSSTTVTQSAITNNSAATAGAGVATDGILNILNSTISANFGTVTGGMFVMENGNATLVNVTMVDNEALIGTFGSGLHVLSGTAVLGNTIIANTTQAFNTCTNASGTITSLGHNLSDDETCFSEATDLVNTDPMLAELSNGARMPQLGSPVIDTADLLMCTETAVAHTDQLGQERPIFNGCDIGAVEWPGVNLYLPAIMQ
ncbi:MAG: CSLREA domain-containing protein [Anaerolineales bacterium]|nr:CSLREA domain-containing protein [Anaerolineales bacterium]